MIFVNPIEISPNTALALVMPLCAAVGLVYKTIRIPNLRQLPSAVLWLWLWIFLGLVGLCVAFYLLLAWT